MPIIPLHKLGTLGLVRDTPFHELPLPAWSNGKNIRFNDGCVEAFLGDTSVRNIQAVPLHCNYVNKDGTESIVYLTRDRAYAVVDPNEVDITRVSGPYSANELTAPWTSSFLTGIPVYNNFADVPQVWTPVAVANPLQNLPNWPSTLRAKVLRAYKNFLVAVGVAKSGTNYPHLVKWSAVADPGAVPPTWDETDETREAGENDLADTPGFLVDCLPLGDTNIVYKEDCVWGMNFIGGPFVFQFRKLFEDFGLFALNCVVSFRKKHCVLTQNDLVVHDGQSFESILSATWRRELFNRIDVEQKHKVFLFAHIARSEIWVCYPTAGAGWCDEALVWNYANGTIGIREMDDFSSITLGDVGSSDSFDSDSGSWDSSDAAWNAFGIDLATRLPYATKAVAPHELRRLDIGSTFGGVNRTAYVERLGWAIDGGRTLNGEPRCDLTSIKQITALYPKFECPDPQNLRFYVASQMFIDGPVTWFGPYTVNPQNGFKIDVTIAARLLGFKVESVADTYWKLWGVDVELGKTSKF